MNYEDKLRLAKEALASGSYDKETIEYIFPELRESKDKRIIRTLKEIVNWGCAKNISVENNVELKDCLAWLEKQGEQKPSWSKEDESMLLICSDAIAAAYAAGYYTFEETNKMKNWLKSFKTNHWKHLNEQVSFMENNLNYFTTI